MTDPQTEAGRRLWDYLRRSIVTTDERRAEFHAGILAIEQEARHAALAEVRRGVEGLEPGWHSDDWAGTGNYQVGFDAALSAFRAILDAAETP